MASRPGRAETAARITHPITTAALLGFASAADLDGNPHHKTAELLGIIACALLNLTAQAIRERLYSRRITDNDPALSDATRKDER